MTSFIQREIARARTFEGSVRCLDARGRPIAGAMVSLYQVTGAFQLGVAWAGEPLGALESFARLGTELLVPYPPSPTLLAACAALSLRATLVLPAPHSAEPFSQWRDRCFTGSPPPVFDPSVVTGWALDLGSRPVLLASGSGPDTSLSDALDALGQQTGKPVAPLGLRLPLDEPQPAAASYGIRLDAPGTTGHLAPLRRMLGRATEVLGACFVHGLQAPQPDPARLPRAWALGGAERFQAEAMAERVTLCFSVPGITGVFCDRLVDLGPEGGSGLLAAECVRPGRGCRYADPGAGRDDPGGNRCLVHPPLRPKRAYKLLRGLLQHEWRTRANGKTDPDGCFAWRGFHGTYEVTVALPDNRVQRAEREFTSSDALPVVWEIRVEDA
jgi:hypothetical protein